MPGADRLLWSEQAEDDLQSIWLYLAEEASERVAEAQLHAIEAACSPLIPHPLKGRAREELGNDIRSIAVASHICFYRLRGGTIEIVRVLHGRRDVEGVFRPKM